MDVDSKQFIVHLRQLVYACQRCFRDIVESGIAFVLESRAEQVYLLQYSPELLPHRLLIVVFVERLFKLLPHLRAACGNQLVVLGDGVAHLACEFRAEVLQQVRQRFHVATSDILVGFLQCFAQVVGVGDDLTFHRLILCLP